MDLNELAVEYYHSSLDLAQKALLAGLSVAGVAYLVAITGVSRESYAVPLVGVEVESLSYFSISLIILFMACGFICNYGIRKAIDNWNLISNEDLAARLLEVPSLFMLGVVVDALLYGFLFMVGASLFEPIFGVSNWMSLIFGSVVVLPYFLAFSLSSDLRRFRGSAQ